MKKAEVLVITEAQVQIVQTLQTIICNKVFRCFAGFKTLKDGHPNLKLLTSENSSIFSGIAADPYKLLNMAIFTSYYMQTYNFNGIDIHWGYPAQRGGTPVDKKKITMLQTLRNLIDGMGGGILSVAVSSYLNSTSYDVNKISQYFTQF